MAGALYEREMFPVHSEYVGPFTVVSSHLACREERAFPQQSSHLLFSLLIRISSTNKALHFEKQLFNEWLMLVENAVSTDKYEK